MPDAAPLPGWDALYQRQAIETMPWFYPELDDDLKQALEALGVQGGSALDLGTGPGTQAMQLAQRGFDVTAADISEAAIRRAQGSAAAQGLAITWQQDDILSTRLSTTFDLIFDRGCFHVLPPERREAYTSTVAGLLKPGAYLFLKCFSSLQPGAQGPHRFTSEQIWEIFGSRLQVCSITETVYQGTLDPLPRALFCVLQREAEVIKPLPATHPIMKRTERRGFRTRSASSSTTATCPAVPAGLTHWPRRFWRPTSPGCRRA